MKNVESFLPRDVIQRGATNYSAVTKPIERVVPLRATLLPLPPSPHQAVSKNAEDYVLRKKRCLIKPTSPVKVNF